MRAARAMQLLMLAGPIVTGPIVTGLLPLSWCWAQPPASPPTDQASTDQASTEAKSTPSTEQLLRQAEAAIAKRAFRDADRLLSGLLQRPDAPAIAHYLRGRVRFQLGRFTQSVADFDRYVQQEPGRASRQWERGIACYYAGKYQAGADQFALYQTYHDNDVENSVWRYLCMAHTEGVQAARRAMLPIKDDRRVPMMQVYRLYKGELDVADVLAAVRSDELPEAQRDGRFFYAYLYLGLWYEANGQPEPAAKYLKLAADEKYGRNEFINRYMWDVARVHRPAPHK